MVRPRTWILVAHKAGARIYEGGGTRGPVLIEELDNPDGHLRERDIDSDRPGRRFGSGGANASAISGSTNREVTAVEERTMQWAGRLAERLEAGRTAHRFTRLVLVAEPHFLGTLRQSLPRVSAAMVAQTVNKDVMGMPTHDLEEYLSEHVPEAGRRRRLRLRPGETRSRQ